MTRSEINAMSKRDLVNMVEAIATSARKAWEQTDELEAMVTRHADEGDADAVRRALLIWQTFDSALKMANLEQFR